MANKNRKGPGPPGGEYRKGRYTQGWGFDRGGTVRFPTHIPSWLNQKIADIADFEHRDRAQVAELLIWLGWGVYRAMVRQLSHAENDGPQVVWDEAKRIAAEHERTSRAPWGGRWSDVQDEESTRGDAG